MTTTINGQTFLIELGSETKSLVTSAPCDVLYRRKGVVTSAVVEGNNGPVVINGRKDWSRAVVAAGQKEKHSLLKSAKEGVRTSTETGAAVKEEEKEPVVLESIQ